MDQRTALMTSRAYSILIVFVHCLHTLGLQRGQQLSLIPWEKKSSQHLQAKGNPLKEGYDSRLQGAPGVALSLLCADGPLSLCCAGNQSSPFP